MRNLFITFLLIFLVVAGCKRSNQNTPDRLIPIPKTIIYTDDSFKFTLATPIFIADVELLAGIKVFQHHLNNITGGKLIVVTSEVEVREGVTISVIKDSKQPKEGYKLKIHKEGMEIYASSSAGVFYAFQTFMQLCPAEMYSKELSTDFSWSIKGVDIEDEPAFKWRGMMLDVSRHFFTKEEVLTLIDELAQYKINTFHLHLVDDQGWRVEIKKYPKLTDIGAWRVDHENLPWNSRPQQKTDEKATYGGFYTQEDIKEIVEFAQDRFITVIPEIEMPGHTTSSLAAYPQYSCTGGPFTVLPGGVWPITNIYCAGKDETFTFIEDILSEVMELFPSKYIHIGGDEANKREWERCMMCQKRIKDEHLADEKELQSYFIRRIERFLNDNNRTLLGWDEILEGGLAPKATVMSWRGMKGGIEAAKSGHDVVMTPTSPCYFDYYQGDVDFEPEAFNGFNPLKKVYSFNPVPDELNEQQAKYILGGQANLWTEYVPNAKHLQYMTFPRILAISEALWSPLELRNWKDFTNRVEATFHVWNLKDINYAESVYTVNIDTEFDSEMKTIKIVLFAEIPDAEIRYTVNDEDLTNNSMPYKSSFVLSESATISAAVFKNGRPVGKMVSKSINIHKATAAKVAYLQSYSPKYTGGGDGCLVNSLRGSKNFGDGKWQAFEGSDCEVVIDFGNKEKIKKITVGCMQNSGSWIFLPTEIISYSSTDGKTFSKLATTKNIIPSNSASQIVDFKLNFKPVECRYLKVQVKNLGIAPLWHSAPGSKVWLFIDEIIVE